MFNQYGRSRSSLNPNDRSVPRSLDQHTAAYKPDFLQRTAATNPSVTPSTASSSGRRIQPDTFRMQSPQNQRAALFNQAREQLSAARQLDYRQSRDLSTALPGGLTERQRMDFKLLQRTDPLAAQKQLMNYQRTSDIRYNKPQTGPSPSNGSNIHRPPTNFNGPRPRFGA